MMKELNATTKVPPNVTARKYKRADINEVRSELRRFSREPFMDILATLIHSAPTPEVLQLWAAKHPDKWAAAISTMARVSGFHDKLEIETNINIKIESMGDAELNQLIIDLQGDIIEVKLDQDLDPSSLIEGYRD